MSVVPQTESLRFDETALEHKENKELYLFQWLRNAETVLKSIQPDEIKQEQSEFTQLIVKVLTGVSPFPQPGRPLRRLATRALIYTYQKGETRTLYDALQSFIKIVSDTKSQEIDLAKIACFYALGECMEKLHSQMASFITDIALLAVRTSKATSNSPLLRLHAIKCLSKSLVVASRAATENALKEVMKMARNLLSDKVLSIQSAAAELLGVLYLEPDPNRSPSDFESVVQFCVKHLDSIDRPTRNSFARCVGTVLASSQIQRATPPQESNKKNKGKDKEVDNDDELAPPPPVSTEAPRSIMSIHDMLGVLSGHFNKMSSSRKTRLGLFDFYAALFLCLGPSFIENNYSIIVKHLMDTIVAYQYPRNLGTRHDKLLVRHGVSILLRDLLATRMLSENGQVGAIRELSSSYLKKWPALLHGERSPTSDVLVIVLREVSGLVAQMGNSPPPVQEALQQPLIQLLSHTSHSVRVAAAWALRCFCFSTPLRLPKLILSVMELLQKDIAALTVPNPSVDLMSKSLGHAYGLAALFAVIPERPLYISYDLPSKAMDMAIQLLKRAGEHEIKVADIEMEIAWICISSLMSLGPNFVKAHLPQLLVLWRNALPKPTTKDTSGTGGRNLGEWMFLLHVRECALGAIFSFLQHNAPTIVSLDVTRRLSSLLSNAVGFANSFVSVKSNLEIPDSLNEVGGKGVTPISREASLRRRAYDCFALLGTGTLTDSTQTTLLQSAISLFGSHEGYAGSSAQAAIASSSGSLQSIWQAADGYGYGVTSLRRNSTLQGPGDSLSLDADSIEVAFDKLHYSPVLSSCEYDSLVLCDLAYSKVLHNWPEPMPPTTAVIDSSIRLFAQLLPMQDEASTLHVVNHLVTELKSPKFEKNTGRRAAVHVNSVTALNLTFQSIMDGSNKSAREAMGQPNVAMALATALKDTIVDPDSHLRVLGSEALGRLTNLGGTTLLSKQVKLLVDTVVSNRDPSARAGCALAFGAIHAYVGGLALGPLLKTTVNILMSLSTDPHPVVHYWALRALSQVIDAASLSYAPFISGTLGMLYSAYSLPSHEDCGGSMINANLRSTLPTHEALCQIIDNVISVMGPELQEPSNTRSLIQDMVHEFRMEDGNEIKVVAIKCIQHFLLFASECVDLNELVVQFRSLLTSSCQPLKEVSINALYQLVQKDALLMSKVGGDQLVETLFRMFDEDAEIEGVRNIIVSWLKQTASLNPSAWIDLCQRILTRSGVHAIGSKASIQQTSVLRDEEGESLGIDLAPDQSSTALGLTSRWRTQLFSLRCLHLVFETVVKSGRLEHLDISYARQQRMQTAHLLVSRVTDVIKMAFTASAAHVTDIRLQGLVVLRDIIESFASSPDPDYSDAPLLEQHQAPITAALTPAFSADSSPEILASAIQVCGVFVGSGIVKEVKKMGRILKLLTSSLEQSKETGTMTIGEFKQLSPNASVMLRIATATAWAELDISSSNKLYLRDVIGPYRQLLSTLWVASLRDYASIRGDSEMLQDSSTSILDASFVALGREVLLPYYSTSWLPIVKAVSNAMTAQEPSILSALDGLDGVSPSRQSSDNEPKALFFVLFGLVYETLLSTSADATSSSSARESAVICLQAMKSLIQPRFCGKAILEPVVFNEFTSLCYRMAITEAATVQTHLIAVIVAFAQTQSQNIQNLERLQGQDGLRSESPLTHCLRICCYILRQNIPRSNAPFPLTEGNQMTDRTSLLSVAFSACSIIGAAMNDQRREDSRAVALSLYSDLLRNETCDWDIIGPTLPSLKVLLQSPSEAAHAKIEYGKLVHGLLSSCVANVNDMRGREGVISRLKVKNNLLAMALTLTMIPASTALSKPLVEYSCSLLSQKLEEQEVSLTAAHCCKSIMLASASPQSNPVLRHCIRQLIPGMIRFVADAVAETGEDEKTMTESKWQALDEVIKALNSFFATIPEEHKARMLGILVPTLMLLLGGSDDLTLSAAQHHSLGVQSLLQLATTAPQAFKEVTGGLEQEQRGVLESTLREALGGSITSTTAKAAKPTIALRSF